jgi:hypothetical protein
MTDPAPEETDPPTVQVAFANAALAPRFGRAA